jgi:hypothetical protein
MEALEATSQGQGVRLPDLLLAVVRSDAFRYRTVSGGTP